MVALILCTCVTHDDITLKMSSFPDRLHPGVKRNAENIMSMKIFRIFLENTLTLPYQGGICAGRSDLVSS